MVISQPTRSMTPRRLLNHPLTLYLIFLVLMLLKLMWLHHNLHAYNITMGLLDKVIGIGSLLLLSFWTWWLPRRGMILSLIVLNLLLTALIYADMVYYRYFQDFLTIPVLMQARQVDALGDSIATLIHASDLWFFADWLAIIPYGAILLFSRRNRITRLSTTSNGLGNYSMTTARKRHAQTHCRRHCLGAWTVSCGGANLFYSKTWAKGLFDNNWWNVSMYNVTGLLAFHGYDLYNYAKDHIGSGPEADPADVEQAKSFLLTDRIMLLVKMPCLASTRIVISSSFKVKPS